MAEVFPGSEQEIDDVLHEHAIAMHWEEWDNHGGKVVEHAVAIAQLLEANPDHDDPDRRFSSQKYGIADRRVFVDGKYHEAHEIVANLTLLDGLRRVLELDEAARVLNEAITAFNSAHTNAGQYFSAPEIPSRDPQLIAAWDAYRNIAPFHTV